MKKLWDGMPRWAKWAVIIFGLIMIAGLLSTLFAGKAEAASVNLAWDPITTNEDGSPITDLAGYYIYFGDTAGGPYPNKRDVGLVTTFLLDMPGAVEGAVYYFVFTGYDLAGNESPGFSNEISGIVEPTVPPEPPINETVGIGLQWQPPTTNTDGSPLDDLSGYNVYWSDASGEPYQSQKNVGNVTSVTWAELGITPSEVPVDAPLYFVVAAFDLSGNESQVSNEVSEVLNPALPTADLRPAIGTGMRFN